MADAFNVNLPTGVHTSAAQVAWEAKTIRSVEARILPFLIVCFFASFLDRVNVGFAALHMSRTLGFTPAVFGLGAGIFFVGYFIFEVPSNLALHRFGARVWIARIMATWGMLAVCCAFISGEKSFLTLRFILGAAEAGFFPGVLLYLTYWFPAAERARVMSVFSLGSVVSLVIGSPLSGVVMTMDGIWSLAGWQWLFILEGVPSILLGVTAYFCLCDRPADAKWLSEDQRSWLETKLDEERTLIGGPVHPPIWMVFRDRAVFWLSIAAMLNILAIYGVTMWLPQLVRDMGRLTDVQTGLVVSIPYLCTAIAMTINGIIAARVRNRGAHILACSAVGAAGFLLAASTHSALIGVIGVCFAGIGIWSSNTLFWTVPMRLFSGRRAAASLALINAVGNLGGFLGPYFTGWINGLSGTYAAALLMMGGSLLSFGLIMMVFLSRHDRPDRVVDLSSSRLPFGAT